MRCPKCQIENKDDAKFCRKCKAEIDPVTPLWKPSIKWHAKVLAVIYVVLIIFFFTMNHILKPYLRPIPKDITPWLKDVPKQGSVG